MTLNDLDLSIVTLLSTVDLGTVINGDWLHWDGTPLTPAERDLFRCARIEHLEAARSLLALDVDAEQ